MDTENRLPRRLRERVFGEGYSRRLRLADRPVYIEWISNKVLLYSAWNYVQYPMMNQNGKEYEKEYICIHIYIFAESL